jgi:hypothetical protein
MIMSSSTSAAARLSLHNSKSGLTCLSVRCQLWEGQHRMQGPMAGRNALETIRGTYMGRGSQDGSFVPGSVENTSPPHLADGRRRYPNAPCPCTESEEGASISEEYYTRIPQHGGLEAHPYRGPAERHRGLVHFPRLYSMA